MLPFVSIVLPIKNEEKYIEKCLDSLLAQDYSRSLLEIIIVDGISTDDSVKIIKNKYMSKYPFIKVLNNPKSIVPISMNIGIEKAIGDIIVRIDAHSIYEVNYVSMCVKHLMQTDAANVGGHMRAVGDNFMGKAIALAHHSRFGLGGGKFHDENFEGYVDTVYLGAFWKSTFSEVGKYDERLMRNQDIELNSRIIKSGKKIYLTSKIKSYYYNRSKLKDLWKQNYKNGYWNIITKKVNPSCLSNRHFIPLIFVLAIIISSLLAFTFFGKLLLILVLGSYLMANIYFSVLISVRSGLSYSFVLPLVFTTLHFSYGFGSLVSFVRNIGKQI